MSRLIGWTSRQIEGYNRLLARITPILNDKMPATETIPGGRTWHTFECQSGSADEDGFYPGWWIEHGTRYAERQTPVRLLSPDGRRLSPGRFYVGYILRSDSNAAAIAVVTSDGPILAKITELRDQSPTWTEYGWIEQIPSAGGGYTDGTKTGRCRAYVRIKGVQAGDGSAAREKQSIAIIGAEGGTFTLTYDGQTTGDLDWDSSAGDIETALEGLSNLTSVTVTGSGTYASPFVVEFLDDFADRPLITATYTNLSPNVARSPAFEFVNRKVKPGERVLLWPGAGERAYAHLAVDVRGDGESERTAFRLWLTGATYGTFTLTFDGGTTAAIDWDADASAVQASLEALANVSAATVTGSGTAGDPFELDIEATTDPYQYRHLGVDFDGLVGSLDYRFEGPPLPMDALIVSDVSWNESTCAMTKTQKTLAELAEGLV